MGFGSPIFSQEVQASLNAEIEAQRKKALARDFSGIAPRERAAEAVAFLFEHGDKPESTDAWHFGRCEIKTLLDFIYGAEG